MQTEALATFRGSGKQNAYTRVDQQITFRTPGARKTNMCPRMGSPVTMQCQISMLLSLHRSLDGGCCGSTNQKQCQNNTVLLFLLGLRGFTGAMRYSALAVLLTSLVKSFVSSTKILCG